MNGFLNILKPPGMTSAAVVGRLRRLTGRSESVMPERWILKRPACCPS